MICSFRPYVLIMLLSLSSLLTPILILHGLLGNVNLGYHVLQYPVQDRQDQEIPFLAQCGHYKDARKRYYFHRPAKASSSNLFSHKYRLLRNFAISMVQKVKFAFLKSMSSSIRSPKQLWSLYHSLDPNCECIPHLQTNGTITAESLSSKANLLNCFFYSYFSSQSSTSYEFSPSYHPELSNIECSEEVERLLCSLETKTSTGPDRILSNMLRNTFYSTQYVSLPHFEVECIVHRR